MRPSPLGGICTDIHPYRSICDDLPSPSSSSTYTSRSSTLSLETPIDDEQSYPSVFTGEDCAEPELGFTCHDLYDVIEQPVDSTDSFTPRTRLYSESLLDLTGHIQNQSQHAEAHGGFSDIYKASLIFAPREKHVPVAVKLLRVFTQEVWDGERAERRLRREAKIWQRLQHSNVAVVYGISTHMSGRPSLIMRWYDNGVAPHYLKTKPMEDRLRIVRGVAQGLEYLHCENIVHGDVKGNNVLITDDGEAVLSDFGLSLMVDDFDRTMYTTVGGSIRWQPPEFVYRDSEEILEVPTKQSDIWSFGCTVYELIVGECPYAHLHPDSAVVFHIARGKLPLRTEDEAIVPQNSPVYNLLLRCWARNPSERPTMDMPAHLLCSWSNPLTRMVSSDVSGSMTVRPPG